MTRRRSSGGHLVDRHAERARRDERVQVLAGVERLDQARVAGQVRHDPHLDLAVVGGHQLGVARRRRRSASRIRRPASVRIGMFCRFGSVDDSRPVAAMVWLNVVWMRPSAATDFSSPSTVTLSRVASRWASRCSQERVPGLVEQRLQRVGVGGVAGLGLLGLRHLQFVEQHHLQLLGRAEVDLLADHRVGGLGGVADLVAELALQLRRAGSRSTAMPAVSMLGQHALHRQFHLAEQRRRSRSGPAPRRARRRGPSTALARRISVCTAWSSTPSVSSSSESCCCSGLSARSSRRR